MKKTIVSEFICLGKQVPVTLLGRGWFATTWRSVEDPNVVFIETLDSIDGERMDYSRVALMELGRLESFSNVHIPPMVHVGYREKGDILYEHYQTRYSHTIFKKDFPRAYKERNMFLQAEYEVWQAYPEKEKQRNWCSVNYIPKVMDRLIEMGAPESMIKAIDKLYWWGGSYSSDLKFDAKAVNFRASDDDHMVFTDPFVDHTRLGEHVELMMKHKHRRR